MIFKPSCNHFCLASLLSWRSGHHKTRIPSLSRSYLICKQRKCVLAWVLILFVTKERDANSKQAVFNLKKRETHTLTMGSQVPVTSWTDQSMVGSTEPSRFLLRHL